MMPPHLEMGLVQRDASEIVELQPLFVVKFTLTSKISPR